MEPLYIKAGSHTPEIYLHPEVNIFYFAGNSFPTNPIGFYQPVFEWFNSYFSSKEVNNNIIIQFELDYYNTSSAKQIIKLFQLIKKSPVCSNVIIKWCYDEQDPDMKEAGERYKQLTNLNIMFSNKIYKAS